MTTRQRTARRPSVNGAARRRTAWDDTLLSTFTISSGGQNDVELMPAIIDPEKRGYTLIRMVMHLYVAPQAPGVQSLALQAVDVGIGLFSPDARAANAFSDPGAAGDFPVTGWIYRDRFMVRDELITDGIVPWADVRLDIRAMRKLDRADPVLVVDNANVTGAGFVVVVGGIIRILYKLP